MSLQKTTEIDHRFPPSQKIGKRLKRPTKGVLFVRNNFFLLQNFVQTASVKKAIFTYMNIEIITAIPQAL
jgi:hypothetical protein